MKKLQAQIAMIETTLTNDADVLSAGQVETLNRTLNALRNKLAYLTNAEAERQARETATDAIIMEDVANDNREVGNLAARVEARIASINAELEGANSNPADETVLTTTDEIATINASLADSPKVAAENAKRVAAGKPRMTAAEAREFEMYSETNANIVENACPNGCVAYEDVFTFNRWIAQGFVVMKGQKSTKITVYTKRETVDATTGEKKFARVPRPVSVFCRCQVTKLGTKKAAA